jgi:uncharacterized damage-inducible protein DinB
MKKSLTYLVLFIAGALPISVRTSDAQNPITEQLRNQWEASRKQMTLIADAMPADKFDFRPVPEVRSFGEIVAHFAGEDQVWMEMLNDAAKPESGAQFEALTQRFEKLKTKPEILKALADSYDYGTKVLAGLTDQKAMENAPFFGGKSPRWVIVIQTIEHTKEHYGNLVTYLRLNHIVPPASR